MKKWLPILALGFTQFDKVFDGTVMNVCIAEVVGDLGTTNGMGTPPPPTGKRRLSSSKSRPWRR